MLAQVSVDYYQRLEQGRERHPSAQVLEALSAALLLVDDERLHLYRLAGLTPTERVADTVERASPELVALAEQWDRTPAVLLGRAYDVLAMNALGRAVFPHLSPGSNLLITLACDPSVRSFYRDWHGALANAVAGFRFLEGERPHDPRIREVLRHARAESRELDDLWRRSDVAGKRATTKSLQHPDVGVINLRMETFDVRSAPGQQLVVYRAADDRSAEGLRLIASLAAPRSRI